jgi:hypothetical protein
MTRAWIAVIGVALALGVVVPTGTAEAVGEIVVDESPDYASVVLHDAWDYAEPTDFMMDGGGVTQGVFNPKDVSGRHVAAHDANGTVMWETPRSDWYVTLMWMTWPHSGPDPGALPDDRDGLTNPLDADRFQHLSMRIFSTKDQTVRLRWFTCREYHQPKECEGAMAIPLRAGWNTFIGPIVNNIGYVQPFEGDVYGIRLEGRDQVESRVRLDWVRIYEPGDTVTVAGVYGEGVYDTDDRTDNNRSDLEFAPAWGKLPGPDGAGRLHVPTGALPPGTYQILDEGRYVQTITIRPLPQPRVLDPDRAGGDDYATTELGNPWDFNGPDDVVAIRNAVDVTYQNGVLAGTNAPGSNDPYIVLPIGPNGLDPVHYHRVTVRTWYDGKFELNDGAGFLAGTHGRLIWRTPSHPGSGHTQFSDGREKVFFTDRKAYVYDMADVSDDPIFKSTAEPNVREDGTPFAAPDLTWTARTPINYLRFDPNEAPSQYRWYVDELRIAADDAAAPTFDIRWDNPSFEPGTVATVRLDDDREGFDGEVLATVTEQAGVNTVPFDATNRLPATYWVNVTSRTPDGREGRVYSTGPLQVSPRISGRDRVATAVELSRQSFTGGAGTVLLASSTNFPDALAAVQLADAVGGPLLLSPPTRLDPQVTAELDRLEASRVIVAGGPGAISEEVVAALAATGRKVDRIGGTDRYDTAGRLADAALARWNQARPDNLILAVGTAFPDALAAGPMVGTADLPLLLSHGEFVADATVAANPAAAFRPEPGSIPDAPGCYLFRTPHGSRASGDRVVYVGKAKSLRSSGSPAVLLPGLATAG